MENNTYKANAGSKRIMGIVRDKNIIHRRNAYVCMCGRKDVGHFIYANVFISFGFNMRLKAKWYRDVVAKWRSKGYGIVFLSLVYYLCVHTHPSHAAAD